MIVVDASVWIDYFNGQPTVECDVLDGLLGQELIIVGDITLAEVLQGFRSERAFERALALLGSFEFSEMLGRMVAIETARNYRKLRAKGVTVRKTIDVMIATFCLVHRYPLLHCDRDFDPMERHLGLRVLRGR
ncbi:MAG: type II toxin-antitoxin system VapC family toxin [Gammaproteobacteria bacterium]